MNTSGYRTYCIMRSRRGRTSVEAPWDIHEVSGLEVMVPIRDIGFECYVICDVVV